MTMAGCAIIEGLCSFWPIEEITVADRGIREGILLDMMHSNKSKNFTTKRKSFIRRSGAAVPAPKTEIRLKPNRNEDHDQKCFCRH